MTIGGAGGGAGGGGEGGVQGAGARARGVRRGRGRVGLAVLHSGLAALSRVLAVLCNGVAATVLGVLDE